MEIHDNDKELVKRAVQSAGVGSRSWLSRWSHVGSIFGLGSTSSWELCKRMGLDPDEQRGGCDVCDSSQGTTLYGDLVCGCDEEGL